MTQSKCCRADDNETYISTQQCETQAYARIPGTHGNEGGPSCPVESSRQGPQAPGALIFSSSRPGRRTRNEGPATNTPAMKTPAKKTPARKTPARKTGGFPARQRLSRAAEFQRVFKRGHRFSDECFVVLARSNQAGCARLGMAIARKHTRTAVARNGIKRLVRESFRSHQQELPAVDIVVMNRPTTAAASIAAQKKSLDQHWTRIMKQ